MKRLLILMVRIYQMALSPWLPPSCRFVPSCSQYAIESIAARGAVRGIALGLKRLACCHPFYKG